MGFRDVCPRPARSWCEGSSIRPLTPRLHNPTRKSGKSWGCGYGCGCERGCGRGRAAVKEMDFVPRVAACRPPIPPVVFCFVSFGAGKDFAMQQPPLFYNRKQWSIGTATRPRKEFRLLICLCSSTTLFFVCVRDRWFI